MTPDKFQDSVSPELESLSFEQVRALIAYVSDARDRMMMKILYETGCNLSELIEIRCSDIGGNSIKIRDASEKQVRFARVSGKLAKEISLFIKGNNLSSDSFLLSTRQSKKMSEKRVRQLVQEYTQKFFSKTINPRMFRYCHVAHAYQNGVFIEEISHQIGLTTLRVFQIIREMNLKPNQKAYNNFLSRVG